MDARGRTRGWLLVAAAAFATACGGPVNGNGPEVAPGSGDAATAWNPTSRQIERATELGQAAAGRLASTLMQELSAQIEAGGTASAIEFCSMEAMELTGAVNAELDGLEVKRTSRRIRNPDNTPDALERAALSHFEAELLDGSLPDGWVQTADGGELRFYRPLVVAGLCTRCHGPTESLDGEVRARLREAYPSDQAVGYEAGDFRGLIRVTIPRAVVERD